MITRAVELNHAHFKKSRSLFIVEKHYQNRRKVVINHLETMGLLQANDYRGRGYLVDDVIFLKCYLTALYMRRIEKRAIKSVTIPLSSNDFCITKNTNRIDLMEKLVNHFNKQDGLVVKLKINDNETEYKFTFTVDLK